jgi:hypothetical protein
MTGPGPVGGIRRKKWSARSAGFESESEWSPNYSPQVPQQQCPVRPRRQPCAGAGGGATWPGNHWHDSVMPPLAAPAAAAAGCTTRYKRAAGRLRREAAIQIERAAIKHTTYYRVKWFERIRVSGCRQWNLNICRNPRKFRHGIYLVYGIYF